MISWLVEQTVILSLICLVLVVAREWLAKHIAEQGYLKLYILLPASLLLSLLIPDVGPGFGIIKVEAIKNASELTSQSIAGLPGNLVVIIWLAVAGTLLLLGCLQQYQFARQIDAHRIDDKTNESTTIANRKKVHVITSAAIGCPCVSGVFKPTLYLPVSFERTHSETQRQLILEHELEHISSNDLFWNIVAGLIVVCFWFNPLMWITYRFFREAQETACDERVLKYKTKAEHLEYAKALLTSVTPNGKMQFSIINYTTKETIKMRLNKIKFPTTPSRLKLVSATTLAALLLVGAHTATASSEPASQLKAQVQVGGKYPVQAIEQGLEGSVSLRFSVTPGGSVTEIEVIESDHDGIFDASAISALSKWQYTPLGEKVTGLKVQLDYRLGDDPGI